MTHRADWKVGRPRQYDLQENLRAQEGFVGWALAALDELRARVYDQIEDLPADALTFTPEGSTLSIAALVIHMAWAEAGWASGLADVDVAEDLNAHLQPTGRALPAGERPPLPDRVPDLIALCERVADEVTRPTLARLEDVDKILPDDPRGATPRGVLMHLIWHWTYHSGQVGLLRELWGSGYRWMFGSLHATKHHGGE
jgi:uncharacterized damage-inducible protein DinB